MDNWQNAAIEELISLLQPDEDVLALLLFGSCSNQESQYDYWSDVDVLLVVKEDAFTNFFPGTGWLSQLGNVYSYDQSFDEFRSVTRVCFDDFHRLDIVLTTEVNFLEINKWSRNPLTSGVKILFSRSVEIGNLAKDVYKSQDLETKSSEQFQSMVDEFRFKSVLACTKWCVTIYW